MLKIRVFFIMIILSLMVIKPVSIFSQNNKTKNDQVYTVVETMPKYPGGQEALMDFLAKNIQYPQAAKEAGITGTVIASFVIEKNGNVSDIKILKGLGSGCDEEVIRVVNLMRKWKAGKQNGKEVRVQYNLPVKFSLK
jgi:protein TonB